MAESDSSPRVHAFLPGVDGKTCKVIDYRERRYRECGKGPGSKVHDGTRPPPPELEFPYPPCSLCGEDTDCEDESFVCRPCGAYWDRSGQRGSWDEPKLRACGATRKPFDRDDLDPKYESIRHHKDYCIREKDHDDKHRADPYSEWEDEEK